MPEEVKRGKVFSLYEVTCSIQKTIANRYKSSYWIKAEMNKLNYYQQSGHCYPELVEKKDGKIIAQIHCNLWKDDYLKINTKFKKLLYEPLKDGIKILFLATIGYHPEYGLTLRIIDIDPSFTLGDLEKEKRETIKKLHEEGIFRKNKMLKIPLLPQRIAIISVETSKGYADFINVFESANVSWGYRFFHHLFSALLQGDNAVQSIIDQLNRIKKVINHFDVVAIVRGGGGDIGLSCYNNYRLAKEIALFHIPVITGIGHSTNETVAELIACENAITPTKLAEFLVQKFHNFSIPVQKSEEKLIDKTSRLIADEKFKLQSEVKLFLSVSANMILKNKNSLESISREIIRGVTSFCNTARQSLLQYKQSIKKDAFFYLDKSSLLIDHCKQQILKGSTVIFKSQNSELFNVEKNLTNMSPLNVLKRGYSFTLLNGTSVTSFNNVRQGDVLKTVVYEGNILSIVNKTNKNNEQ